MKRLSILLYLLLALSPLCAQTNYNVRGQRDPMLDAILKQREAEKAAAEAAAAAAAEAATTPDSTDLYLGRGLMEEYRPVETMVPGFHPMFQGATVALIMPFNLASTSLGDDKMQMRTVEFYQGFLQAVEKAQQEGQNITVQAYDLGTRSLSDILTDEELLKAQVIVAPIDSAQIRLVATFGESHGVPVLSPFTFCKELMEYPHLFQLNTTKNLLYDRLSEELLARFRNFQFVFVSDSLYQDNKDPYPLSLQAIMDSLCIPYHRYIYNDPYSVVGMDSALQLSNKHVLYILETPQRDALRRFFPSLKNKLFLDAHPALAKEIGASYASGDNEVSMVTVEESFTLDELSADTVRLITEERQVAILGYPEWQQWKNDFMEYFYDLNVWMFTKFYVNPFDSDVQSFYNNFKYWYNREPLQYFLKYALLGYDVGAYTLDKLRRFGTLTSDAADENPITPLQTLFYFEQQEEGCFLNRGLYLVHFTPETTIEKYEIK